MKSFTRNLLAFAGLCIIFCPAKSLAGDLFDLLYLPTHFADQLIHIYNEFSVNPDKYEKEKFLYSGLSNITQKIDQIEINLPLVTVAQLNQLGRDFPAIINFEIKLDELNKEFNRIQNAYVDLTNLKKKWHDKFENETEGKKISLDWELKDFAEFVISRRGSIRSSLDYINNVINTDEDANFYGKKDFFTMVMDNFNNRTATNCVMDQSAQQIIHDTLSSFKVIQLKGLVLFEFAYLIQHFYTAGDFKESMSDVKELIINRLKKQEKVALGAISKADNSFWRCDPDKHIPDKTYVEITRLLQGYVHNEKQLSAKSKCFDGCESYTYVNKPKCDNSDDLCKKQTNCGGRVMDCKFVANDMDLCFSNNPVDARRYDWIKFVKGPSYGDSSNSCPSGETRIKKFRQWLAWRCLYCFCLCDDETNSDRYFSLHEAVSDVSSNKVIVGVRFTKKDRIIHLQVREGKLSEVGLIDNTTLQWVELPNIKIGNWFDLPKYHKLTYEKRSIDLDDYIAPSGFLVTGVRFKMIGAHLNLEVRYTGFDFKSGLLNQRLTYWKNNHNMDLTEASRPAYDLSSRNRLPTYVNDKHVLDSKTNTYVKFQQSDKYTDASQSTVPFIDAQTVSPNPSTPLVGVGIAHKGAISSSGFITPKVFTLNVAEISINYTSQ